jgi:hypothetical protein
MIKIIRYPGISKPLTWIILFSFLIAMNGCYYFKVIRSSEPPTTAINAFQEEHKSIYIHLEDQLWHFSDIKINDENISGTITNLSPDETVWKVKPEGANRYRKNGKINESEVLNEVHIFVREIIKNDNLHITFPLTAVDRIEVYDKATGATVASWTFSVIGISAAAAAITAGIIIIIALLTKQSCPFIYTYNGNDFIFTGEIFSGATQPGLERDDYLLLPDIVSDKGNYKIKISNEIKEIQSINLAELIVIDHPADQSVLIDKYGTVHSFDYLVSPVEALDNINKTDILPLIREKDSISWSSNLKQPDKSSSEEIVLKFVKPADATTSKLIIRAKNSFWLDGLVGKIQKYFGDRYDNYMKKQEKVSPKKLQKWQLDQKMPLSVYVEENKRWKFVDYFNLAGPMALKDDILELNLNGIKSDTIKIKLETGFLFWEIDYAAMDFNKIKSPEFLTIQAKTALDNNNTDVKNLLSKSDNEYYVQSNVGNEAELTYNVPTQKEPVRSVFLHSRGHYRIIREQSGKPDIKALKTFRKAGRVPEFSKETFDKLKEKLN